MLLRRVVFIFFSSNVCFNDFLPADFPTLLLISETIVISLLEEASSQGTLIAAA